MQKIFPTTKMHLKLFIKWEFKIKSALITIFFSTCLVGCGSVSDLKLEQVKANTNYSFNIQFSSKDESLQNSINYFSCIIKGSTKSDFFDIKEGIFGRGEVFFDKKIEGRTKYHSKINMQYYVNNEFKRINKEDLKNNLATCALVTRNYIGPPFVSNIISFKIKW